MGDGKRHNAEMIRPLRRGLWFVRDRDYNAYDTLAVVDNLQKKFEEGDILPEAEIISNQAPAGRWVWKSPASPRKRPSAGCRDKSKGSAGS